MKIRTALIAMTFALLVSVPATGDAASSIQVNGRPLALDSPPMIDRGRVLVPLRGIFEALGANVAWDAENATVYASKGNTVLELQLGSNKARVNGMTVALDVPAKSVNGRTVVPLRFVAEVLGAQTEWDPGTGDIRIQAGDTVEIHVLDVHGYCTYIKIPGGVDILIDGGKKEDAFSIATFLWNQHIDDLEILVLSDSSPNNVGGLDYLVDNFTIETIIDTPIPYQSNEFKEFQSKAGQRGTEIVYADHQVWTYGNCSFEILSPLHCDAKEIGDFTTVSRLRVGAKSVLFASNIGSACQSSLANTTTADVIVHEARSSVNKDFFVKLNPEKVVISGEYPSAQCVRDIKALGIPTLSCKDDKSVQIVIHGQQLSFPVPRVSWKQTLCRFEWKYGGWKYWLDYHFANWYLDAIKQRPRLTISANKPELAQYVAANYDREALEGVLNELRDLARQRGYVDVRLAEFTISFVQDLKRSNEDSEHVKYPVETLIKGGNATDKALLAACLLKSLGYDVAILALEDGHTALGISHPKITSGSYYLVDGVRYTYVDVSGDYELGKVPSTHKGKRAYCVKV